MRSHYFNAETICSQTQLFQKVGVIVNTCRLRGKGEGEKMKATPFNLFPKPNFEFKMLNRVVYNYYLIFVGVACACT